MEVFPLRKEKTSENYCLLHVRGGVSIDKTTEREFVGSSPRPWRCFYKAISQTKPRIVFSTSVEVFPFRGLGSAYEVSLLHVRGGVSKVAHLHEVLQRSSPRPWRCFRRPGSWWNSFIVFSTSVEVFPHIQGTHVADEGLLHVRGGVSFAGSAADGRPESSSRPWRCFYRPVIIESSLTVFSTSVEVFPDNPARSLASSSLLHVRGGVSFSARCQTSKGVSSPRPWRCFHGAMWLAFQGAVFSTSVEVFLPQQRSSHPAKSLLHVRGGVSRYRMQVMALTLSSPRPWRCFYLMNPSDIFFLVFSTSVEVFPCLAFAGPLWKRLLHVRGGVSNDIPHNALDSQSSPRLWRCFWP